jgi:hypothetical protein
MDLRSLVRAAPALALALAAADAPFTFVLGGQTDAPSAASSTTEDVLW